MNADVSLIEGWVSLELLGHRRMLGKLSIGQLGPEANGPIVLRLDVPPIDDKAAEIHFYSPQAIYGIHPRTEAAVIDELTPWRECGEPVAIQVEGSDEPRPEPCTLRRGHDGPHEDDRLPF